MKILEAYTPEEIRACGKMVKRLMLAGGKAEDILGYAAYAEAEASNPRIVKLRLFFKRPEHEATTKSELLGAFGYELLREWLKLSKDILGFQLSLDEIRSFIREERKKTLSVTKFGWVRG